MTHPRGWRTTFVLVELVLLLAVPVLAYKGFAAVLDTTDGRAVDPELDPEEPGYEAFVESTPVLGVLGRDDDGRLSWAAVLALSGPGGAGGSVLLVPVATLVPEFAADFDTLAEVDAAGGAEATTQGLADILGVGVGGAVEVDAGRLAGLVDPVTPLRVASPDAVGGFDAGPLDLAAADAGAYLAAIADGESDLTRMARHEAFWRAWLAAVGASADRAAVPGEASSGIGRFIRGLAAGSITVDVPPMTPEEAPDGAVEFRTDPLAAYDLTEERIPFPASPRPGVRSRVRVLDGVGADGLALRAGRDAVAAGGQLVVIGNADRFGVTTSRVVYFEDAVATHAAAIAEAFGVTAERLDGPNPDDGVDVTVVAGRDMLAAYGLVARHETIGDDAG